MTKLKYIFSFLSFYLSLCYASSSRLLPSYIDRASQKWVVGKRMKFFVALGRVHNDACTNRITNSLVWGICSLAERLLMFPKSSTELFVTGWMDLLQSVRTDGCVSPFFFIRRLEALVSIYVSAVQSAIPTANCRAPNRLSLFLGSCGWWHGVIAYHTTNKVSKSRRPRYGTSLPWKAHISELFKSLVASVRFEPEGAVHILHLQISVMCFYPWFE
jgi:hypothetical protein